MKQMPPDASPDCTKTSLEFMEKVRRYIFNKYGGNELLTDIMFEMMSDLRPFPEGARASINIPVAGHQESQNIYRALLSYTDQGEYLDEFAGWDTFEINLFVNTPEPTPENPYNWDETLWEIERFQSEFPRIHINIVTRRLQKDFLDIGIIRGIITDVHLLRSGVHPDHVIISHDADQVALHPRYIKDILAIFHDPDVQIFGGKTEEDSITHLNHPDLFVRERFWQFQSRKGRNTPGANSAYRASAYIRVGGYQPVDGKCGEDNDLGQRIYCNSWDNKTLGYYGGNGRVLRVVTNGRRKVGLVMQHGKIPGRHEWEEVHEDGTSGFVNFGPDDAYRNLQMYPDTQKLSSILQDDNSWTDFLQSISPYLFQKIHFHTADFASVEYLAQKQYGTDDEKKSQIKKAFKDGVQVPEYDTHQKEILFEKSPLKVGFPFSELPEDARRAFTFLGVEDIHYVVHFFPELMNVLVDFEITRADTMRAGLQKFLDKMKTTYSM